MNNMTHKICTKCNQIKSVDMFATCRGKYRARCKSCHSLDAVDYAKRHREQKRVYFREYMRNKRAAERPEGWQKSCPPAKTEEERLARKQAAAIKSRIKNKDKLNEYRKRWILNNSHKVAEKTRRYQAAKKNANVQSANKEIMALFYAIAKTYREQTGFYFEVDHIVPLTSNLVCGLHVEHNLCIIERSKNRSKANRYWPDMPNEVEFRGEIHRV